MRHNKQDAYAPYVSCLDKLIILWLLLQSLPYKTLKTSLESQSQDGAGAGAEAGSSRRNLWKQPESFDREPEQEPVKEIYTMTPGSRSQEKVKKGAGSPTLQVKTILQQKEESEKEKVACCIYWFGYF